jgi:putative chitinase
MAVNVTVGQILLLAPSARSSYREAFQNGQPILERSDIAASPLRVAHFMAQILHESGALAIQFENLNYSSERLPKVWPRRFRPIGPLDPAAYAHNPQRLANEVYGRRMGNVDPNDGYTYRGRGLLQLTGKDRYAEATTMVRRYSPEAPDFVASPDEVIGAQWCLAVAASEWAAKGCNALADEDNIRAITRAINGGQVGLAERIEWSRRTKAVWISAKQTGPPAERRVPPHPW